MYPGIKLVVGDLCRSIVGYRVPNYLAGNQIKIGFQNLGNWNLNGFKEFRLLRTIYDV